MNTTLDTPWPPGEERTFYLYSVLAGIDMRGTSCIPFRATTRGIVCKAFQPQTDQQAWRVALTLVNGGSKTISAGFTPRFGIQLGGAASADDTSAPNIDACGAGEFSLQPGVTSCQACPIGSPSTLDSSGNHACVPW